MEEIGEKTGHVIPHPDVGIHVIQFATVSL